MKPLLYIICGRQGEGKTTFAVTLAAMLKVSGIECGGFYSEGFWNQNERSGFDIVSLDGSNRKCLCNRSREVGDVQFRRFFFKPEGLNFGREILSAAANRKAVIFIDEVGSFEVEGGGWADSIEHLLLQPPLAMIWSVRESIWEAVAKTFNVKPVSVWNLELTSPDLAFAELLRKMKVQNNSELTG